MKTLEKVRKEYINYLKSNLEKEILYSPQPPPNTWTGSELLKEYENKTKFGRMNAYLFFAARRIVMKKEKGLDGIKYSLISIL
jgi:hypothetical protein